MTLAKILVAGTGGTIAGRSSVPGDNVGYRAGEVGVAELLAGLPLLLPALTGFELHAVQVAQVDSKDMGPAVWLPLIQRLRQWVLDATVKAVVVTHGTDTLEETAFLLSCVLPCEKPVVLTCAMRPATALVPDGPQNLLDALSAATDGRGAGVFVVAAGQLHSARHVSKVHPYRLDAFSSGDAGPLGCVEEGVVRWFGHPISGGPSPRVRALCAAIDFDHFSVHQWPRVEVILSHAGVTGDLVDALLMQAQGPRPLRGLVVACTGNGTLHADLVEALHRAVRAGVVVWRATRCAFGQVVGSGEMPEMAVATANVVGGTLLPATALSPVKARIAMMLQLMAAQSNSQPQ